MVQYADDIDASVLTAFATDGSSTLPHLFGPGFDNHLAELTSSLFRTAKWLPDRQFHRGKSIIFLFGPLILSQQRSIWPNRLSRVSQLRVLDPRSYSILSKLSWAYRCG